MQKPPRGMRICPTRPDGRATLFAHAIGDTDCAKRQDERYHKCASCVFAIGYELPRSMNGTHSAPARPEPVPAPPEPVRPEVRAVDPADVTPKPAPG